MTILKQQIQTCQQIARVNHYSTYSDLFATFFEEAYCYASFSSFDRWCQFRTQNIAMPIVASLLDLQELLKSISDN